MDETYSLGLETGYRGCAPMSEEDPKFSPTFYRNMFYPLDPEEQKKIHPHFIQRYPPTFQKFCYRGITLAFPYSEEVAEQLNPYDSNEKGPTFKNLQYRFRSDGKLMYTIPDDDGTSVTGIYDRKEYCVDLITDYGIDEPFRNHENQTILFICASQSNSQDDNYR
ncbi:hypothetical protein Ocin01_12932 [Orchesella cincta]|uniref:Uncharacterized protein n=1 Tax=Orchesella cincta TaxID=48709 RepID=A0A1D2ML22_ORCCI|nr:hypothetical protein Ocin01_12932 [Orchesella cincta]